MQTEKVEKSIDLENIAEIMRIISHPTRLRILYKLRDGKKCVCQLLSEIPVSQSNLSQHLSVLKLAGLVKDKRQGNMVEYELSDNKFIQRVISCIEDMIK